MRNKMIALALTAVLCLGALTGCGRSEASLEKMCIRDSSHTPTR